MQIVSVESRDLLCSVYMFARRYEGGSLLGLGSLALAGYNSESSGPQTHHFIQLLNYRIIYISYILISL